MLFRSDPSTLSGLRAALRGEVHTISGRGAALARLVTPLAKVINAARGNRRIAPGATFGS